MARQLKLDLGKWERKVYHEPRRIPVKESPLKNSDADVPVVIHRKNTFFCVDDGWNFDAPTPEENEEQQRVADKSLLQTKAEKYVADYETGNAGRGVNPGDYQFWIRARGLPLNPFKQTDEKKMLLQRYYHKFRQGGAQDINAYSAPEVGALFKNVFSGIDGNRRDFRRKR